MTHAHRILLMASISIASHGTVALAEDRAPTEDETARIEEVLRAEGFTSWEEIEFDDDVWEIDDAVAEDGTQYDITLDANFAILERDED